MKRAKPSATTISAISIAGPFSAGGRAGALLGGGAAAVETGVALGAAGFLASPAGGANAARSGSAPSLSRSTRAQGFLTSTRPTLICPGQRMSSPAALACSTVTSGAPRGPGPSRITAPLPPARALGRRDVEHAVVHADVLELDLELRRGEKGLGLAVLQDGDLLQPDLAVELGPGGAAVGERQRRAEPPARQRGGRVGGHVGQQQREIEPLEGQRGAAVLRRQAELRRVERDRRSGERQLERPAPPRAGGPRRDVGGVEVVTLP